MSIVFVHMRVSLDGFIAGPNGDPKRAFGADIVGKRTFEARAANRPDGAPSPAPVYVLTHEKCEPAVRPGGSTFHFVNDGIESALRHAKAAAGAKDVRISGGASVVRQYLEAGFVDELHLALAPVLLGDGVRLFDRIDPTKLALELGEAVSSPAGTHLRYRVRPR